MPKAHNSFAYRITALSNDEAELFIYGDIGDSWFGESVTAKDIADQLATITASKIYVRINSFGGAVADALAIHNALRRHAATIAVTVDGLAVSAASLIAMAGDTIEMGDNALMMIHAPIGGARGNAKKMRQMADVLDRFAEAMSASYVRKTGKSADAILELLTDGDDHWYTAAEAVEEGFADGIIENGAAANASAFDLSRFLGHAPTQIAASLRPSFVSKGDTPMTKKTETNNDGGASTATAESTATNVVNFEEARKEARDEGHRAAMAALKERNREIKARFAGVMARDGVREIVDAALLDPEMTVDALSQKVLAKLGEGAEPINQGSGASAGEDEADKRRGAMSQALLARMGAEKIEGANPFRGHRLADMARASLEAAGVSCAGRLPEEFCNDALRFNVRAAGGQTTSDFPILLEDVMHKLVLRGFEAQPVTYDRFCRIGDVSDFREWNRLVPGLIGNLDGVNEAGEYKNKNIPDAVKNAIKASRHGNIIAITPEVLVNDDTGFIQSLTDSLGRAGGRTIERQVYALIEANPALSDGVAVFHANHNNLAAAGAVPSVAALDAAASAMAQQTAPGDDAEYLDITPAVAVVNRGLKGQMVVLVEAQYDPDTPNKLQKPNMVKGIVGDIVASPRLSAAPWYLFADANVAPVFEVVFLNGQRAPRLVQEESFRTGGLAWRVELPFGVGAIDFRGGYKNPGA